MTTDMPEKERDSTASVIHCIDNNQKINNLAHTMLHICTTVEEYTEKLNGLLRIFWGESTPEGKSLDKVTWVEVVVQILPTECLIPIFKNSMLKLEGNDNEDEETTTTPCDR